MTNYEPRTTNYLLPITIHDFAKVEEIYHAALDLSGAERDGFLRAACGGDEELRREVESLIAFDEPARSFIESPPEDVAANYFSSGRTGELVGKRLNHYQILSWLGAGGMGEVYLAEDTKLRRKVALKLLPMQFSRDAERKSRFEREAYAVSALNHPNIITIHEIGEADGLSFIVTEQVDGQTLRERISEAPLTAPETVEIGIQIAGALASAHAVGIIHRDIKPANIMIRRDGLVKVLDFGLAKLAEERRREPFAGSRVAAETENSISQGKTAPRGEATDFTGARPTFDLPPDHRAAPHQTDHGAIMGTLNYMSPEQARGQSIDARSDIFSLGVVLYEMLSGAQPFGGAGNEDIYEATLNKNPQSLHGLNAKIPAALERVITRALTKDRAGRYQTAAELRLDLQKSKQSAEKRKSAGRFAAAFTFVLAAALAIGYFAFFRGAPNPPAAAAQSIDFKHLTSGTDEILPSLSPDGKALLFTSRKSGNWDVYRQQVGETNAVDLTQNSIADDTEAVFSPDGKQIAFRSDRDGGGIFVMDAGGENVRRAAETGYYPAWSPDGTELVFCSYDFSGPTGRSFSPVALWIVNLATGAKRELTEGDAVQPSWSPNGARIAFWGMNAGGIRDIKTISRDGGEAINVTDDAAVDWNPVWSPDGKYLYFASNRGGSMNFWRVAIDQNSGKTQGAPEPFTTPSAYSGNLTFSADGKTFAYVQTTNSSSIVQTEFNAQTATLAAKLTELTHSGRYERNPWVSPDGEWIAFDAIHDKQEDIFVMRRAGGELRQLTDDASNDRAPRWSPDGKKIVFYSDRSGTYESWTINPDGTGLERISSNSALPVLVSFWSPDGKKFLQNLLQGAPRIFDAALPLAQQTPLQIPAGKMDEGDWLMANAWSPNGEKIATLRLRKKSDTGGIGIYTLATGKFENILDFGDSPLWLNDNRRLLFVAKNKVYLLDSAAKKTKEMLSLPPDQEIQAQTISPDNRFLYLMVQKSESNIWIAATQ